MGIVFLGSRKNWLESQIKPSNQVKIIKIRDMVFIFELIVTTTGRGVTAA